MRKPVGAWFRTKARGLFPSTGPAGIAKLSRRCYRRCAQNRKGTRSCNPQNRRLGYARVSTYGQTLDAQLEQLRGAGCTKIYREKVTGAHSDRRELLKLLKGLAPGDVVTGDAH